MKEQLLLLRGDEVVSTTPLEALPLSIGSDPDCGLRLDGGGIPGRLGEVQRSPRGSLRFFPEDGEVARLRCGEALALDSTDYRLLLMPSGVRLSSDSDLMAPLLELVPRLWEADPDHPPLLPILETLRQTMKASWGAFARRSDDDRVEVVCVSGERPAGVGNSVSRTALEELERSGEPVMRADVHEVPSLDEARSIPAAIQSVIAGKLLADGEEQGLIYLESPVNLRAFASAEMRLLEELCGFVASILGRSREAQEHARRSRRLGELYRLSREREHDVENMVARSKVMKTALAEAKKVAESPTSVLLLGETGTGKELLAQAVHRYSDRREEPFVPVNCAAIPRELIESYLFGHRKGAFSDAVADRVGVFELADGGTLFLDEVAEMPLESQAKLLRALETRQIVPVGETEPRSVDVRIVAATHADLEARVEAGSFRKDLYYRLAVFVLRVPPLRARAKDIPLLVERFLREIAQRDSREPHRLTEEALDLLVAYPWRGNIRELRNMLEQAALREEGDELLAGSFDLPRSPVHAGEADRVDLATARATFEKGFLEQVLKEEQSVPAALERLGISQSSLYGKCKTYGIDLSPYRKR